jgi:hypothetical protein
MSSKGRILQEDLSVIQENVPSVGVGHTRCLSARIISKRSGQRAYLLNSLRLRLLRLFPY